MTGSGTLGSRIVTRRNELGLGQAELASMILSEENDRPISAQYLNDIETGRRRPPSARLIKQLAKALKDDPEYLLYLAGTSSDGVQKRNSQPAEHLQRPSGVAQSPARVQATLATALARRPPPPAAIEVAKGRLENFSLSKFQNGSLPANFIPPQNNSASSSPADRAGRVHEFQRGRIQEHLDKLDRTAEQHTRKRGTALVSGMTVAIHNKKIASVLPSYDDAKRTIDLDELMGLIARHTTGTEFYADGHPTLKRLALLARMNKFKETLGIHQRGPKGGNRK